MNTHYPLPLQVFFLLIILSFAYTPDVTAVYYSRPTSQTEKARVIVTTDGEADDRASMVRFLLSANEFDVEGIINSSSQFHWEGGKGWNAFHPVEWIREYIEYYKKVYPNLLLHDKNYPSPEYLLSKWKVGNIKGDGEYRERTEGAQFIAKILLTEDNDPRPVWIQAWGGCNTLASALKIIQEDYPEKMEQVAAKMRLFLIWEQDKAYQEYIRPNWEHFQIPTIISDQFDCMAYIWNKVLPASVQPFFQKEWMTQHILQGHGALCDAYPHKKGAFNAEGDTPAFLHSIPTGLRNMENPGYGGWGGRYVKVRNNVWMDPQPSSDYSYPTGQYGFDNSWSKMMEHYTDTAQVAMRTRYFQPLWRWLDKVQLDFAARADWCVKDYASANHHPVVNLNLKSLDLSAQPGEKIILDASQSQDPDGDLLKFHWWMYPEASSYKGNFCFESDQPQTAFSVPQDARPGDTIHLICEVSDNGVPSLTRYKRIIIRVSH